MDHSFPIRCSNCQNPTGAWHHGGDPYLPYILCTPCHEAEDPDRDDR